MFEYTVKNDMNKCWDNSQSAKVKEVDAFIHYLSYIALKPADMLHTRYFFEAAYVSVMALPATVPIAILTAPVFFVSRRVSVTKQKIDQFLENRKQEKVKNLLSEGDVQTEVSPETWQKAVKEASNKLFLMNKKRMIVINEISNQPHRIPTPKQLEEKQQTSPNFDKEFIFVLDEDKSLFDVLYLLKKEIKKQADSIYLILDSKILNSSTKISSLQSNQLGIIRLGFTKIETFG